MKFLKNIKNPLRQSPLQERIEADFDRIDEILQEKDCNKNDHCHKNHRYVNFLYENLRQQNASMKQTYSTFLIWMYIWNIMKLMKMSSSGEILKNIWIDRINRIQGRISLEMRTHRGMRNISPSIRLPFHIQGRG